MTQQIINYDEEMVGENHPTKPNTLGRAHLISHDETGGMKGLAGNPGTPEDYQYYWCTSAAEMRIWDGAAWQIISPRFAVVPYTGDTAATKAITGVGFQPTLIMIYEKGAATGLVGCAIKSDQDGASTLLSHRTANPSTVATYYATDDIISRDVDGFTVGDGTTNGFNSVNAAVNYIALCWG